MEPSPQRQDVTLMLICTSRFLQVIAHLDAETEYTKAALADTEVLQESLYKELRGRIQVNSFSVLKSCCAGHVPRIIPNGSGKHVCMPQSA